MGRTDSVLSWCDRLAQEGFAAVALDFFDGEVAQSPEEGRSLRDAANTRSAEIQHDVEQAYRRLVTDPRLRSDRRFLLGWSFGAAWATYAAGFLPDVQGVVAYYGQAFTDAPQLSRQLSSPLLFIGGQLDSTPSPEKLVSIVSQLRSNGKRAELCLFAAGHGFAERTHPGYDFRVAEKAWVSVIDFLQANRD